MRARKGRASYLGERSVGHQDPGATSSALLLAAFADTAAGGPAGGAGTAREGS
jgi:dihydroxyacetone kinase-like protein